MPISFIIGGAGTAKTTKLVDMVCTMENFICLGYTHSAVGNMKEKYMDKKGPAGRKHEYKFRTIHSFFQIPVDKIVYNYAISLPKYMFIDEFSLIPLDIITMIFELCKNINLVLVGDLLQLNPISRKNPVDITLFQEIDIDSDFQSSLLVADHLVNSIYIFDEYKNSNKVVLTENYRNNSSVMNILEEALSGNYTTISNPEKYIRKGYTVLSSKYAHLKKVYGMCYSGRELTVPTRMGFIGIDYSIPVILTENISKDFFNGDIIYVESIQKSEDYEMTIRHSISGKKMLLDKETCCKDQDHMEFPILPINYITIHKAQGRSIDNCLIVLDDMFEITMLYTAITRARFDVKFMTLGKVDLTKFNRAFCFLRKLMN